MVTKDKLKIMSYFLEDQLTLKPRKKGCKDNAIDENNLGYVFTAECSVGEGPVNHKSCRTYYTLSKRLDNFFTTYWTPNTFYHWQHRNKESLRWINAFSVDIDETGLSIKDILSIIEDSYLPEPTLVNRTPSGGVHVFWKIFKTRAYDCHVNKYEEIIRAIVKKINADEASLTPERYFRIPCDVEFFKENVYDFETFTDWLNKQDVSEVKKYTSTVSFFPKGILGHPSFKELFKGVNGPSGNKKGKRDNTAFTLALALKLEGYSFEEALEILTEWNKKNRPPLTYGILHSKVSSAYRSKSKGPSADWVTYLSGITFTYRVIKKYESKGIRKSYNKLMSIKGRIFLALKRARGSLVTSQSKFSKALNVPLRSLQKAIKELKEQGKIIVTKSGKGRYAVTAYELASKRFYSKKYTYPQLFQYDKTYPFLITQITIQLGGLVGGSPPPLGYPMLKYNLVE